MEKEDIAKILDSIRKDFTFDSNNICQSPGKFEGEHIATAYYYDMAGNGESDVSSSHCDGFEISDAEREIFSFDKEAKWFVVEHSNDGFIIGNTYNENQINKLTDEEYADDSLPLDESEEE